MANATKLGRALNIAAACSALIGCLSASFEARADKKSDEKAIRAVHAKLVSAFRRKDVNGIVSLGTKDFTEKGANGTTMTADQSTAALKQQFADVSGPMNVQMSMDNLKVEGSKASYSSTYKMSCSIVDAKGQMGPKGKKHKMVGSGSEKIEMVKEGKAWKFKHVESVSEKMTLDGKPMPTGAQAGAMKEPKN